MVFSDTYLKIEKNKQTFGQLIRDKLCLWCPQFHIIRAVFWVGMNVADKTPSIGTETYYKLCSSNHIRWTCIKQKYHSDIYYCSTDTARVLSILIKQSITIRKAINFVTLVWNGPSMHDNVLVHVTSLLQVYNNKILLLHGIGKYYDTSKNKQGIH